MLPSRRAIFWREASSDVTNIWKCICSSNNRHSYTGISWKKSWMSIKLEVDVSKIKVDNELWSRSYMADCAISPIHESADLQINTWGDSRWSPTSETTCFKSKFVIPQYLTAQGPGSITLHKARATLSFNSTTERPSASQTQRKSRLVEAAYREVSEDSKCAA